MSVKCCVIAFNSSCKAATDATFTIECTDIHGNQEGDWVGIALEELAHVYDNFSLDPVFCDKLNKDYRLRQKSPCAPANSGCGELVGSQTVGCQRLGILSATDIPMMFQESQLDLRERQAESYPLRSGQPISTYETTSLGVFL